MSMQRMSQVIFRFMSVVLSVLVFEIVRNEVTHYVLLNICIGSIMA